MILDGMVPAPNAANLSLLSERVLRSCLASGGMSVRRLLPRARLDLATQLPKGAQRSVSEIGAAVGYADPPSFIRFFRKHFNGRDTG
jgi:AraC-like DNA-binding protein